MVSSILYFSKYQYAKGEVDLIKDIMFVVNDIYSRREWPKSVGPTFSLYNTQQPTYIA